MRDTDRTTLAVGVAMALGAASLAPLTTDRFYLVLSAALVLALQSTSLLLRRTGLRPLLVHLVQVLLLLLVAVGLGLGSQPEATRSLGHLGQLFNDAVLQIRVQSAPMATTPSVRWLMVLLVGVVTIVADVLVTTLRSTAWMLASLLTLYLIPALAVEQDVHWLPFALLGLGYLLVLVADGINENVAWTRNLASDSVTSSHTAAGARRLGALVGVPALALALLLGQVAPRFGSLDIESARPRGSGPIQMADPTLDMSKNLNLPSDRVVLTYQSDEPLYLRTASLTVMDAEGWHMAPAKLEDGPLPAPPGLTTGGKQVSTQIDIKDLNGEYLPAPYAPQNYTVDGRWRHDPATLTILSTQDKDRTEAIRNKSYRVTSKLNDPGAENFTLAQPGTPPDVKTTSAVPKDVPKTIMDITHQVTKEASTPVLKAAAIQAYLASPRNFGYSTTAPPGNGFEVLTNFLTKDKMGYCVHFASSMALMARIEGIPSRVSVGFLPGEKVGDHYEVRASNMHAWPELYFAEYGWVRFEPTSRVASAPEWSLVNKDVKPLPSATASAGASSAAPTPSATVSRASASPSASAAPAPATDQGLPWGRLLAWGASALGVLLVLALPAIVRALTRRKRLGEHADIHQQVADGWYEVRDSIRDLGSTWPPGTMREKAVALHPQLDQSGREAIDGLVHDLERSRFAPALDDAGQTADQVRAIRADLAERSTTGQKVAAALLPRSLWAWLQDRRERRLSQRVVRQSDFDD
ncbi:transglutaminaseTgpA domain-containing protein [Luteococcus sp.]|uniref:transglutaminase family protein n=1 Tax=Luteococcus sp. TaxID=1969402 RepID=UPI003735DCB7